MGTVYHLCHCHRRHNDHCSIAEEQEFVCNEMAKLLASGAVTEVRRENLIVCNPLGVVKNSARKPRLIGDLRYVNQHLRSHKFKYEDIRTAADLFSKGDWFFKFNYKSGYDHIEILHSAFSISRILPVL